MSSVLFILNDAPYGNERAYNGLRLAGDTRTHHEKRKQLIFHPTAAVGPTARSPASLRAGIRRPPRYRLR
jgi:sulfur relay (sulfurtransferase) complex TusBCD TusD component (DsrE family)